MTGEQAMKAIAHYTLSVFAPTNGKVKPDTEWIARTTKGEMMGWGATPIAAVADAVKEKAG